MRAWAWVWGLRLKVENFQGIQDSVPRVVEFAGEGTCRDGGWRLQV